MKYKSAYRLAGWATVIITAIVYFFSVQRTGSLWDCGEFVSGAYKMEVVHPPGAPMFLIIAHMFAMIGDWFSSNPANIAFMVNLMSGLCSAFAAGFIAWITFLIGKIALVGNEGETSGAQNIALALGGITAGTSAAFCVSVWFSAVEGEVYAMSFFFTMIVFWAMVVWYSKPDEKKYDRWLLFALYAAGLSTGVHLLSLLTLPSAALLYYFKKYEKTSPLGILIALIGGAAAMIFYQKIVIVGIPTIWAWFDYLMVNELGMAFNSGAIPTFLVVLGICVYGLYQAHKRKSHLLQLATLAVLLTCISFMTIGVVVIRANANPPINMNDPDDPYSLLPYLNREQYGDRPLLYGPDFTADYDDVTMEPRYERVDDKYEVVSYKMAYVYDGSDKMLFPRLGHMRDDAQYRTWIGKGEPTTWDNLSFFIQYQVNWMYWRYFMWNFVGRLNFNQGYTPANKADGQWYSGVNLIAQQRLYKMDKEPSWRKHEQSRNTYYFIPLILGLIGVFFLYRENKKTFFTLLVLFTLTGLGIIIYSNQPPQEPRERDYVLVGSFAAFAMFIGLAVPAIFRYLSESLKSISKNTLATLIGLVVMIGPALMAFQNYDDMSRKEIYASRDYAINFLQSVDKNAILFTYGDNDTYPLWYAQEVEGIRTDVRVVNLSLIAVDWYINQLRRQVNNSPAIDLSIPQNQYRGYRHNQLFLLDEKGQNTRGLMTFNQFANMIASGRTEVRRGGSKRSAFAIPTHRIALKINRNKLGETFGYGDSLAQQAVDYLIFDFKGKNYLLKDEIAIMDVIGSNINKRPIYFATTVRTSKMVSLTDYMQLEGLAMRVVPIRSESNQSRGIFGLGRVDAEQVLKNAQEKYRWGGFDVKKLYVNEKYGPAIQSHRMVFMRAMEKFMTLGKTQKAVEMANVYFTGFPNMNFPFGYFSIPFIEPYLKVKDYERAEALISQTMENLSARLDFYESLDLAVRQSSFGRDYNVAQLGMRRLLGIISQLPDSDHKKQYMTTIQSYLQIQLK